MLSRVGLIFGQAVQQFHARRFLAENHARRKDVPLDLQRELPAKAGNGRRILLLVERDELFGRTFFLDHLGAEIVRGIPSETRVDDIAIVFGYSSLLIHAAALRRSSVRDVLFLEAGYLRSVLLDNSGSVFDQSICFFVDDLGFHFDATMPTRIETLLNDPELNPDGGELERAGAFRRMLVENRLTKYNDQPDAISLPPKRGSRILVVEQSRRDWAVLKSGGSARSFRRMLATAFAENPDSEILVKVHPDSIDGKRGGTRKSYYGALDDSGRVSIIRDKVNPYALLAQVDEVYVFSSMLGFEAAMMGKTVHVFGTPCYSGWGVTRDRAASPRRARRRTLDELVHVIYFSYQKYKNLEGDWCTAEAAADILLALRERHFAQAGS